MSRTDTGKEKVEQLIMSLARGMTPPSRVSSLVWWSTATPEAVGDGPHNLPNVPLRIYSGNSWRSMEFLRSDIDDCGAAPEVLKKYEGEISQILAEL
ncbi:MAG: hypothetical protein ABSG21_01585 [Spirochaetia bacterium]|jgi:hypothetical protein